MSLKIVIDMMKCRSCSSCTVACSYHHHPGNNGMLQLLEQAAFRFTCRQCDEAPCISVCPVDALEKGPDGTVVRAGNLCIACKSCVMACPFGTMMNNFFEVRKSVCDYCGMNGSPVKLLCIDSCPEKALTLEETAEDPANHLHKLNEKVLVREIIWEKLKHE
ncbi:MAG: 4Fe-4S binding protein [Bacteroidales bacterium]|nr:4Fe-4S binding protein [Bacteroidales bacterium]